MIILGGLGCLVQASCVGMPGLALCPEVCGELLQELSEHHRLKVLSQTVGRAVIVEPVWWLLGQGRGASQLLPVLSGEKQNLLSACRP